MNYFLDYLRRQHEWSLKTFGPGKFREAILEHIKRECDEVRWSSQPNDLDEWIDIITLACTGAMRAGYTPDDILCSLEAKLARNKARRWPKPENQTDPIEHIRSTP